MTDDATAARPSRRRSTKPRAAAATGEDRAPDAGERGAPALVAADRVEVRMAAVGRADTASLDVSQGAVGAVRADDVRVSRGAVGAAMAGRVELGQSFGRALLAREASVRQSIVRTIVAAEVRLEQASVVGVLVARNVVGDVRVLLDWRGALAFGAAFGAVAGLVGRGRRRRGEKARR